MAYVPFIVNRERMLHDQLLPQNRTVSFFYKNAEHHHTASNISCLVVVVNTFLPFNAFYFVKFVYFLHLLCVSICHICLLLASFVCFNLSYLSTSCFFCVFQFVKFVYSFLLLRVLICQICPLLASFVWFNLSNNCLLLASFACFNLSNLSTSCFFACFTLIVWFVHFLLLLRVLLCQICPLLASFACFNLSNFSTSCFFCVI